jgi:nucleotide-binding universal stress UspA family protein
LDGSLLAECSLPHAVALARAFDAQLRLVQVLEKPAGAPWARFIDPLEWHVWQADARAYLERWVGRLAEARVQAVAQLVEGTAASAILSVAGESGSGLIVLSSHGQSGLSGWTIGSVVQKVMDAAHMPVMIVRAGPTAPQQLDAIHYRTLMVPLDGSQRAECSLPIASTLARARGSRLLLAHVAMRPEMPRRMPLPSEEQALVERLTARNREAAHRYLTDLQGQIVARVETRLLEGSEATSPLHTLSEREDVDLLVMGAHGYTGAAAWPYGRTALHFIVYGRRPLMIVQDQPGRADHLSVRAAAQVDADSQPYRVINAPLRQVILARRWMRGSAGSPASA